MLSSYYVTAWFRTFVEAWEWPNSHGIEFTLLTLVCAVVVRVAAMKLLPSARRIVHPWVFKTLSGFIIPGLGGLVAAFLFIWAAHFVYDAPKQLDAAHNQVLELEGKLLSQDQRGFSFRMDDFTRAGDETFQGTFTVTNASTASMELIELALVRITGQDLTYGLSLNTSEWCKEVDASPRFSRMPGNAVWIVPNNELHPIYQYLKKTHLYIDNVERRSEAMIVERDKTHIFSIEFTAPPLDLSKTNAVVLCPVVIYAINSVRYGVVCVGTTKTMDRYHKGKSFSTTNESRYTLVPSKVEDRCRALHFL